MCSVEIKIGVIPWDTAASISRCALCCSLSNEETLRATVVGIGVGVDVSVGITVGVRVGGVL